MKFDPHAAIDSLHDRQTIPHLMEAITGSSAPDEHGRYFSAPDIDLSIYDHIIVCSSGGKDSLAALLTIIERGADRSKIELWHHDVDGREGTELMDWPFMRAYNQALAEALGLPIYFSWLEGGFEGEMLKRDSFSRPHKVETPDGLLTLARDEKRGSPGTRMRFPQTSPSLQTRWCSSALKIDVGRRALNNQSRFNGKKVLFVTGERRAESAQRSKYFALERHACDRRAGRHARHVDHWRPVLPFSESAIWSVIAKHRIIAPLPYRLGWSRSSCQFCIFNSPTIWSTLAHYFPERTRRIADYEDQFGTTISRDRINVLDVAKRAAPFLIDDTEALEQATKSEYSLPIFVPEGEVWRQPAGAFKHEKCGSD